MSQRFTDDELTLEYWGQVSLTWKLAGAIPPTESRININRIHTILRFAKSPHAHEEKYDWCICDHPNETHSVGWCMESECHCMQNNVLPKE